jgi:Lon protease-like protein
MLLPRTVLFPQAFLPLYIFENHYRKMLKDCLHTHRLFAVARPRKRQPTPHPIGCLGLIRACVDHPDGTSHLVLQGLCRVRFTKFYPPRPYLTAAYQLHTTHPCAPHPLIDHIVADIHETIRQITARHNQFPDWIAPYINNLTELDTLCDIIAHNFIHSLAVKHKIICEQTLPQRLRLVRDALHQIAQHI